MKSPATYAMMTLLKNQTKVVVASRVFAALVLAACGAGSAAAQTDEIQVYDGEIAEPGIFNLTWHNNYTPVGRKTPGFPGGLINNHNLNESRNGLTV